MNAKKTLILASLAGLASVALAQQSTILYLPGKSVTDQNIGLRSWGSGTIRETSEAAYEGTTSVSVFTRNLFQGGIMMYGSPVDLSSQFSNSDNLIRITFKLAETVFNSGSGGPGGGGGPAGVGGLTAGGAAGGGQAGRVGGLGLGGGAAGGAAATQPAPLKTLRVIVTTTDGKKSEIYIPVSTSMAGERGWRMVAIPLQAVTGLANTNKTVKELAFSADTTATIYVGDVRVVSDSTKITGEIVQKGPLNLALGDEVTFSAYGFGGSSPLKFQWDFDASDGIQVDAEGQTVKRKFRKAGHYKITLTVSDVYGLKAPATSTIDVTVNP